MSVDIEEQYDKIYIYCYFKVQNRQTAEDITQETFLRFWEAYQGITSGQALKYLYTIARNLCVDEYRKYSVESKKNGLMQEECLRKEALQGASKENGFCEEAILTSLAVKAALSELEREEQELLLLRYVNEVPVFVIGKVWGISRFAAYRKINAASKKLKEKLREEGFQ